MPKPKAAIVIAVLVHASLSSPSANERAMVDFNRASRYLRARAAFFRNSIFEIGNERVHAPHDLHTGSATGANLIKGQAKQVVPRRERDHES
jgi:hypothetical protein